MNRRMISPVFYCPRNTRKFAKSILQEIFRANSRLSRAIIPLFMALRIFLLVMLLSTAASSQMPPIDSGVSRELARWRAERYSDVRYKLSLTLEKMSPVLKGTMEIRVKVARQAEPPASAGGGAAIVLDWRKIKGFEDRSTVGNVSVNGRPVVVTSSPPAYAGGSAFEHNEHLIFRDGVVAGENVIKLDFTSPILPSGSAITRYVDKEDGSEYIYSLFVPSDASTAFPVFDQPDLKARFGLHITAPNDWKLVSNTNISTYLQPNCGQPSRVNIDTGKVEEVLPYRGCNPGTSFAETKPISTYVFAFAAGPFEREAEPPALAGGRASVEKSTSSAAEGLPPAYAGGSAVYVRKSQATKFQPHAAEVFRLNQEAVKYFEEYFDYKFPFPKYDLVLIPEFPFGGMEHAGATFLREASVIFPQEPTRNDHINRATLIFHEAAHQWFGDTVTMRWFDDLWLKEGFATFTAYKALEKIMPEMNAWKVFYERIKQGAYQTDSTCGTTPIYQEIPNLSAAKSAYGNIVYNKAPAFLRQAEFYVGEDRFRTAVRSFLKKHEFGNAQWPDLVGEFETAAGQDLSAWSVRWVLKPGVPKIRIARHTRLDGAEGGYIMPQQGFDSELGLWAQRVKTLRVTNDGKREILTDEPGRVPNDLSRIRGPRPRPVLYYFLNYGDYGYGIFLLDEKSRDYVLENIQNEKDPFLRSMMWGALWDSVREGELDPREYVELAVKVLSSNFSGPPAGVKTNRGSAKPAEAGTQNVEDESTTALLLNRVGTALNYYIDEKDVVLRPLVEDMLIAGMRTAPTQGQRITYYRAFLNVAVSEKASGVLKEMLAPKAEPLASASGRDAADKRVSPASHSSAKTEPPADAGGSAIPLKTKDRFDIVTRLLVLGDPEAPAMLAGLEKVETSDEVKRYAYAARAGIATAENKGKYWKDFTENKEISESWIEAAFGPWNSIRHSELTLPYLEPALRELSNHKRNRKIFFVNGWLGAFIGGQRSQEALAIVNKFLADNPNLDKDLRLKILENVDVIERAVKIRAKFGKNSY